MAANSESKFLILCDGIKKQPNADQIVHEIQLGEGKDKVRLRSDTIKEMTLKNVSPAMLDLLEIATFVYVAGQLTRRGGQKELDYGAKWYRQFDIVVPVREKDIWLENKDLLEELLEFVAGSKYNFFFEQKAAEKIDIFEFTGSLVPTKDFTEVAMLSGGLDSFAGGIHELQNKNRVVFVSHQSDSKMTKLQRDVFNYLSDNCQTAKPLHIPIKIHKGGTFVTKDTTQRDRSFLFSSLGAVVAESINVTTVKFYENGIVSCNLPFDNQTYQAARTRSTHPKFLKQMSELVSNITNKDFNFINPFIMKTRGEIVEDLVKMQHQQGIPKTRSCASSRYNLQESWRHDGVCSQCIGRRFATIAKKCEAYDLQNDYHVDIFFDDLDNTHDRTMVAGFVTQAETIEDMQDVNQFQNYYSSDLTEIISNMGVTRQEAARAVFNMYKRYALEVTYVLDLQITKNPKYLRKATLAKNCLLNMIRLRTHTHTLLATEETKKTKKHAKGELNEAVKNILIAHPDWDSAKIADKEKTTSDAVRKTPAWKKHQKIKK